MRLPLRLPCTLALATLAVAQAYDRAELRAHAATVARSPAVHGDRLCVKLAEGCGAELRDGRLVSRTGVDLSAVQPLFAAAAAEPLFTALSWEELDAWHRRACAALPPGNRPGHLGLWFRLVLPSAAAADELTDALFACDLVEHVHKEPQPALASVRPVAGDLPPPTPSFTAMQGSHEPSPTGYGVWRAQTVYGARGQGVSMRMVEDQWFLDHEDVSKLVAANFLGAVPTPTWQAATHGVAGTSIFCADRNGYGLTGVADEVEVKFLAVASHGIPANALLAAGASCQPGDVHLLVLMFLLGQLGIDDWVPLELLQSVFDATLTLTGNGRIVVTTAANGGRSLDDPRLLRRFDRGFRDSGAIMISASEGSQLARASFGNFGSRVDGNGWGRGVVACGQGSLFFPNQDQRQAYTANYTGTSPAVPGVAGVVASLQGAARAQLDRSLTTAEILNLLHTHGPLSPDAIGRRPDLVAMLQAIGAIDGLEADVPDTVIGGTATIVLRGAPGSAGFLFASFTPGSTSFGLNRRILLGLSTLQTIGFLPMPSGAANWTLQVPNDPSLHGVSLYFQAGRLAGTAPIHVTNSVQVTIL
ncbi:MAG: hypothetical protein FJ265_06730 [Planctomycetes bacterium]|nr:hypothetical protein [Planctomycetota bacterium]